MTVDDQSAQPARLDRPLGAITGLLPAIVVGVLYAIGPSSDSPAAIATGIALVALIGVTAGFVAGPVGASEPRRLLAASLAYAIALIGMTALLSIVQGVSDAVAADGLDPVALGTAGVGRAAVAVAGAAYLIVPAIAIGLGWSVATYGLAAFARQVGPRRR
jgi:hypothetical protein